jgi:probable phosphoglycerate mutase
MAATVRTWLIRHGETDWNAQRRWQGMADIPLNAQGEAQARALADYLAATDERFDLIISSDLSRARATAAPLAARFGLTPEADPRLREIAVGAFEGLSGEEVQTRYADEYRRMREDYLNFVFPGGESRKMVQARAYEALTELLARVEADDAAVRHIALVTHGGVIALLLAKLFPHDGRLAATPILNTSMSILRHEGHHWTLEALAITPHLPGA